MSRIYTHDLANLIDLAGLRAAKELKDAEPGDFRGYWTIVSNWNETVRYESVLAHNAARMVEAVGDPDDGVLPWLKSYW